MKSNEVKVKVFYDGLCTLEDDINEFLIENVNLVILNCYFFSDTFIVFYKEIYREVFEGVCSEC